MKMYTITVNVNDNSYRMSRDGLEWWDANICDWDMCPDESDENETFAAFNALEQLELALNPYTPKG